MLTIGLLLALGGSAEAATVDPSSKDYGSLNIGTTSPATQFALTTSQNSCSHLDPMTSICDNPIVYQTSTTALGGAGATITSGDFTVHNLTCPSTSISGFPPVSLGTALAITCHFEATFTPTAPGPRSTTLSFPDTGGPTAVLTLTGSGPAPGTPVAKAKKCKRKKKHRKCKKR
jgi:hypothetical protein